MIILTLEDGDVAVVVRKDSSVEVSVPHNFEEEDRDLTEYELAAFAFAQIVEDPESLQKLVDGYIQSLHEGEDD